MRIYTPPEPPTLMRVNIKKQLFKTEHIAIEGAGQYEVIDWLKKLIEDQKLSIFNKGQITTVEVRESIKGINGKTHSFAFKGLDPLDVIELIKNNIK